MHRRGQKWTWQEMERENGVDFENLYFERLGGARFEDMATHYMSSTLLKRLLREWIEENGKDLAVMERGFWKKVISLDDPRLVDGGKVKALRKAGWSIKDIAIDCHCEESCVREILNGTT